MAISEHIEILRRGVKEWNTWRRRNRAVMPDLSNCELSGINLYFAANLYGANFSGTDLSDSHLEGALLHEANLRNTNLRNANLRKVKLIGADLQGADLTGANLHRSDISCADFREANLTNAQLDIERADKARFHNAILKNSFYVKTDWLVDFDISPLELAWAEGLDQLDPSSEPWLVDYLGKVFEYAHDPDTADAINYKTYVEQSIDRIKVLQRLYRENDFSEDIVESIHLINSELIAYLRKHPDDIHNIHWRAFEELVAELLSGFGWEVQLTSPTKDNGYDIFGVYKDTGGVKHAWIIECKKWAKDRPVGIEIARALYGVKTDLRVGNAMLATTSNFTKGTREYKASRYDFELKDYQGIIDWINTYKPYPEGRLYIKDNRLELPGNQTTITK